MGHVFISYNRKADGDFADLLASKLQSEGLATWVDTDMLNAGEEWRATIDQAIRDAFVLVVIMSPDAKLSEYVTYEWSYAWGAGVKILPVLFQPVQLHPRLEALQYVDFTSRSFRPWDRLIRLVKQQAEEQAYLIHTQQESLYELLPLCTVRVLYAQSPDERGTGFFVAPNLILTAAHIVKRTDASNLLVEWNEQAQLAQLRQILDVEYPDLALLECSLVNHPCVYFYEEVIPSDRLYSYGYTDNYREGDTSTYEYEGRTGGHRDLLKMKFGEVRYGMNGAPLLNIRTGGVCGMVKLTRGVDTTMGGRAIPTKEIFQYFPQLKDLQAQFHQENRRWMNCLSPQQRQRIALSRSR